MPQFSVNFADIKDQDTPPGAYNVAIKGIQLRQSESSDYPYLNFKFEVMDGPITGDSKAVGNNLWGRISFSPKAGFMSKPQLKALGIAPEGLMDIDYDDATGDVVSAPFIDLLETDAIVTVIPQRDDPEQMNVTIVTEEWLNGPKVPKNVRAILGAGGGDHSKTRKIV